MRVYVTPTQNKPQGFNAGKLAKRGIFACYYDCGDHFSTRQEAKHHTPCPNREECDRTCQEMKELAIKRQLVKNGKRELHIHTIKDAIDEKVALIAEEAGLPNPSIAFTNKEQSVFDELPVQTPEERVIWFLCTSDFGNRF